MATHPIPNTRPRDAEFLITVKITNNENTKTNNSNDKVASDSYIEEHKTEKDGSIEESTELDSTDTV